MVYDNTIEGFVYPFDGVKGFTIHKCRNQTDNGYDYELYTDDGRGNGDHICTSADYYWIVRIANSLNREECLQ